VVVEAVPGQVGPGAAEPLEGRWRPVEDAVPFAEPRQPVGLFGPEPVRVVERFLLQATDHRIHDVHGSPFAANRFRFRTIDVTNQPPAPRTAAARARARYRPVWECPPGRPGWWWGWRPGGAARRSAPSGSRPPPSGGGRPAGRGSTTASP